MKLKQTVINAYNSTAQAYGESLYHELEKKPLDRLLLQRFADKNSSGGLILDLACGPGQTTQFLFKSGIQNLIGIDLSPNIIKTAQKLDQHNLSFEVGDMMDLRFLDNSIDGVICFYGIVHFTLDELEIALKEIHRVLKPGGQLFFTFHIGNEHNVLDEFFGKKISIIFYFFEVEAVLDILTKIGFHQKEVIERHPYADAEYPSKRAYILIEK